MGDGHKCLTWEHKTEVGFGVNSSTSVCNEVHIARSLAFLSNFATEIGLKCIKNGLDFKCDAWYQAQIER